MKRFKSSIIVKIAAAVLSVLLLLGTVFFGACAVVAGVAGAYTGEYARTKDVVIDGVMRQYAYDVADAYLHGRDIDDLYGNGNFYYSIKSALTDKTNRPKSAAVLGEVSVSKTKFMYEDGSYYIGYNEWDVPTHNDYDFDVEYEVSDDYEATSVTENVADSYAPVEYVIVEAVTVTLYEKAEKDTTDLLSIARFWLDVIYDMRESSIALAVICLASFVFILIFMFCGAGYRKGSDEPTLGYLDKIPFDLFSVVCAAIVLGISVLAFCAVESLYYSNFYTISEDLVAMVGGTVIAVLGGVSAYFIVLTFLLSFATRVKVGGLIKSTLIYRILEFVFRMIKAFFKGIYKGISKLICAVPLVWKTVVFLVGMTVIEFVLFGFNAHEVDNLVILWIVGKVIVIPLIIWVALMLRKLKKGGEAIAAGRMSEKIDTKYMPFDFGEFGETLNNIGGGLEAAVDEKMRSERLKTELITNVSHDIKTPLTSIVNYVDLIKKENIESEKVREYVEVLDRHSARLKKLIEDLVEASKASTGNISVESERCDVGVLLEQSLGEYNERLAECQLSPIVSHPSESIYIMADGRRLWRVFDNLLCNVCKYSMPQTRVYITLEREGDSAVITIRNISRESLNISSDELMERFVRGDSSRNTEGSGLGLSIAKSLTELQGGSLDIAVDGDLFKATLVFPTVE